MMVSVRVGYTIMRVRVLVYNHAEGEGDVYCHDDKIEGGSIPS